MKLLFDFNPTLRRNLIIYFCASLCFWAGLAGMLPNLSLYIEGFGASNQEIGWVMAAFAAGLLGFRPKMSRFTDQKGRKPALLIGAVVVTIAPLLYLSVQLVPSSPMTLPGLGWSIQPALLLLAAVRAFHGISIAAFATAYSAAIADMAPPQHRGELIGYMSLASPIGMAIGPAIGGYLESNFALAFVTMAVLGGAGTICVLMGQEPARHQAAQRSEQRTDRSPHPSSPHPPANRPLQPQRQSQQPSFWRLLLQPTVRVPALILFVVGIAFGSMVAFVPLHTRERDIVINIGLIYTASAIASFSTRAFAGKASDQLGRGRFISLGLVFYSLSMLTLWLSTDAPMLLIAGALQGAGSGTLIPIIAALMADRSQPHERGLTFGLCLTGFDLGIALAGPIMGQVADLGGYNLTFALSSLLTFVGLLVFITTSSKDLTHSIRFALKGGKDIYAVPSAAVSPSSINSSYLEGRDGA